MGAWAEVRTAPGRAGGQLTEHCPGKLVLGTEAENIGVPGHLRCYPLTSQGQIKLVFLVLGIHEESEVGPVPSTPLPSHPASTV